MAAIDAGDIPALERMFAARPTLARERLDAPGAWLRDKIGGVLQEQLDYALRLVAWSWIARDCDVQATPLHHAVSAGSLDAVRVLVESGARLDTRDTAYGGTPLGWAEYAGNKDPHAGIAAYLRERESPQ